MTLTSLGSARDQFGVHGQAGGGGCGDQIDDHFVTGQRFAALVEEMWENSGVDLVPLGGAGREVTHGDGELVSAAKAASSVFHSRDGSRWSPSRRR